MKCYKYDTDSQLEPDPVKIGHLHSQAYLKVYLVCDETDRMIIF